MHLKKSHQPKKTKSRKKWPYILLAICIMIIALRVALPQIVLKIANRQIHSLANYTGYIRDIDMRLYRGAYIAKNIKLIRLAKNGQDQRMDTIPFLAVSRVDISLDWKALFKGKIAGKIIAVNPVINYVSEVKPKELEKDTAIFINLFKKMMPLSLNRFEIHNGQIHYIDLKAKPFIDMAAKEIFISATNLTNVEDKSQLLPAKVKATAKLYGGNIDFNMRLNPLKRAPTFDFKTELKGMDLVDINDFFKTYGNIEIKKGTLSLYAEFAGKEGKFGGYVKPFIYDFQLKKYKEENELSQRLWELLVGSAMKILENPHTDEVATKIPIKGEFKNPEINIWQAIHYVLRNAFVQAIRPKIENSINVNHLSDENKKTTLEKVFEGKKREEKQKEKKSK